MCSLDGENDRLRGSETFNVLSFVSCPTIIKFNRYLVIVYLISTLGYSLRGKTYSVFKIFNFVLKITIYDFR